MHIYFSLQPYQVVSLIPILQMRILALREVVSGSVMAKLDPEHRAPECHYRTTAPECHSHCFRPHQNSKTEAVFPSVKELRTLLSGGSRVVIPKPFVTTTLLFSHQGAIPLSLWKFLRLGQAGLFHGCPVSQGPTFKRVLCLV